MVIQLDKLLHLFILFLILFEDRFCYGLNYNIMIKIANQFYKKIFINNNLSFFTKFIVNNPTTGQPCMEFQKTQGQAELKKQDQIINEGRKKWIALNVDQRRQKLSLFIEAFEKNKNQLISVIESSTGKHKENATLQVQASLSILKQDLSQNYPGVTQKSSGIYNFKPFGNILVVCDYRMVTISCVKYIILSGIAGNSLIFNPHRYGLPIAKKIEQIWKTALPEFPILYCPVNNFADGLEYLVQKKNMGFVSFTGDIQAGNSFYHFMAQKSEILAESQFLLTSSDSAYILKDLNDGQLKRVSENLSMACFMGGGNLFNSVKRIFVDQQISQKFTQYLVEAAQKYKISHPQSKCSPIITQGHRNEAKKLIQQLQQYKGQQMKLLTEFETKESYKSLYVSPIIYKVDGIPNIEYWNKIYPMPVCFIQTVSSKQSAIEHINESVYGITSTIYTNDKKLIEQIGRSLDVGVVYGNRWSFTPGVPFSPRKRSGKGLSFSVQSFNNIVKSQSFKNFFQLQ